MSTPKSKLEEIIETMYKVHTPRTNIIHTGALGMEMIDKIFKEVINDVYPPKKSAKRKRNEKGTDKL